MKWLIFARLGWVTTVIVYLAVSILGLPDVARQYNELNGVALQAGFQNWSESGLRVALSEAGISVATYITIGLLVQIVIVLGFVALGLVIFWRRSDDWIGLFTALFLVTFGIASSNSFSALSNRYPGLAGGLNILLGLPWLGFYIFFYIFPDGRFIPRWTKAWALILLVIIVLTSLTENPPSWFIVFIAFSFLSALVAQVYRYWKVSSTTQKAQTKWVVFAITIIALGELIGQGLLPLAFPALVNDPSTRLKYSLILNIGVILFLLVPLSITIAILRYRLFDIDLIIRRTLQYSLLSGLLGLVYFGGVTVLQSLFTAVSGQQSAASLVLSTLAIAALFNPLRRRVQDFIDRRFYRQKYDAEKALEEFAEAARQETDLAQLSARLNSTVQKSLQPEQVSLWLRPQRKP